MRLAVAKSSRWLTVAAAFMLGACNGGGADNDIPVTGVEVPEFRAVDTKMREVLQKLDIPGASITVAKDGRILYQRGFGWADRATGQAVQPQTLFRVASVSKAMTAVAVLRAFEAELPTALERPVFGAGGLLSGPRYAQVKDSRVLKITLRDLLQHTGGWDRDNPDYDPQYDLVAIARAMNVPAPAGAVDVIEYMLKYKDLQFEPGTRFAYSNLGYNVLGRVLEERTGLPYAEAMRRLVFAPAGVTTAVIGGDTLAQRLPGETIYYDDPRWPDVPSQTGIGSGPRSYNDYVLQTMDAHGGWVISSADMVRFADAVDGRSGVPALLTPATVRLATTPDPNLPDMHWGLGVIVTKAGWYHSGETMTGTHALLEHLDNGVTWSVVYNSLPVDPKGNDVDGVNATKAVSFAELQAVVLASVPATKR